MRNASGYLDREILFSFEVVQFLSHCFAGIYERNTLPPAGESGWAVENVFTCILWLTVAC